MRLKISTQEYNLWQARLLANRRHQESDSPTNDPEGNPEGSSSHLQDEIAEKSDQSPSIPAMHSSPDLIGESTLAESNPSQVMGVDGGESARGNSISPFFEGEETAGMPRFDSLEDIIASLGINDASSTTTIDLLQGRSISGARSTSPQPPELSPQNSYSADLSEPLSSQMQLPILENSMEQWGVDKATGMGMNQLGLLAIPPRSTLPLQPTPGPSNGNLDKLTKSEDFPARRQSKRKQKSPRSRRGRVRGATSSRSIDMDNQLSPRSQLQAQIKKKKEQYAQLKPHVIKPSIVELTPVKNRVAAASEGISPISLEEDRGGREETMEETSTSSDENSSGRLPSFNEISNGYRQRRSIFTEVLGIDGSRRYAIEGDGSVGSSAAPHWENIEVETIGGGGGQQQTLRQGDKELVPPQKPSVPQLDGGLSGINLLQQYLTAPPQNRSLLRQSLGLPPTGNLPDNSDPNSVRLQQARPAESSSASLVRSGVESLLLALRTSATIKKSQERQQQAGDKMALFKTPLPVSRSLLLNSRETPLQRPERPQSVLPSLVQASQEQIQRLKAGLLEEANSGEPSSASNEVVRRARHAMWAPTPQFPSRYPQNSQISQQGQLGPMMPVQNFQPYPIPPPMQASQVDPFQGQLGGYPPIGNNGGVPPYFQRYQQIPMQQAQEQAPFFGVDRSRPFPVGPSPTPINPMNNGAPPMVNAGGAQFMQNPAAFNRMPMQLPPETRVPNPYLRQPFPFQNNNLPSRQAFDDSPFTVPKGRRGWEGAPIRERARDRPFAAPYQIPEKYGGGNNPNYGIYNNGGNRFPYGPPQQAAGAYPMQGLFQQQQQVSPGFQQQQQQQQQQIHPALLQRYQQMLYNRRLNNRNMGATQGRPDAGYFNNYPQFYARPQEPPQYQQQFVLPPGQQQQLSRYGLGSQSGGVPIQQQQPIISRPNFDGGNHAQGRGPSPGTTTPQQQFFGGGGGNMDGRRQQGSHNAPKSGSPIHQPFLAGSSPPQRVPGGDSIIGAKSAGPQSPVSRPSGLGGAQGSSRTGGGTGSGGFSLPIIDTQKPESPPGVQPPRQFAAGHVEHGDLGHRGGQPEHLQRAGDSRHSLLLDADRLGKHTAWKPAGNGNNNGGPTTHSTTHPGIHPVIQQPAGNTNHPIVEPVKIPTPPAPQPTAPHEKLQASPSPQQTGRHLPHHGGDMPLHSQSELDAHHRRLLANAPTAKDSEFENNSAILSWYLQRAKQELRNKQESGAHHQPGGEAQTIGQATGSGPSAHPALHSPPVQQGHTGATQLHVATPHSPGPAEHRGATPEHHSPSVQLSPASPHSGGLPKAPTPSAMVQTPANPETLHGRPTSNGLQSPAHQNGLSPVAGSSSQNAPTPPVSAASHTSNVLGHGTHPGEGKHNAHAAHSGSSPRHARDANDDSQ